MVDQETAANPADEETVAPVAPAPEQQEAKTPAEEPELETEEQESEPEETDELDELFKEGTGPEEDTPEVVEVEYEGKKYNLPPELKEAFLRHADYTHKTMDLAEKAKEVEAAKAKVEAIQNLTSEQLASVIEAEKAKSRVEEILNTPIDGLTDEQITRLRLDLSDAERHAVSLADRVARMIDDGERQRVQLVAKEREECLRIAAKQIPNFTDQRRAELETLAVRMGAASEDMATVTNAAVYKLLHLASIGEKFLKSKSKTDKVEKAQVTAPVPEIVGKKTVVNKDPDNMTPDEWRKLREKQLSA